MFRALFLCLLLSLSSAAVSAAQDVEVPFDEAGLVRTMDAALAARLQLFQEYDGFREARLFRLPGGAYELVVQYHVGGETRRDRKAMEEAEVQALRRQVTQLLAETVPIEREKTEDGRRALLATTTLSGGVHGLLLPIALGIHDETTLSAVPLIGMAVGFGAPFMLTRGRFVSETQANLTTYGALQGLAHGLLLGYIIGGDDLSAEARAGLTSVMGIGQTIGGYAMAEHFNLTPGHSEAIMYGSLYGFGYGAGTSALIQGTNEEAEVDRLTAGTMIIGSLAGSYGGYLLANQAGMTTGDVRITGLAGLLGLQTAGTFLLLMGVSEDHVRANAGLLMAGTTAGLFSGHVLVRNRDFTRGEANTVSLGTFAGTMLGAGVTTLAGGGEQVASVLGLAGSVAGFWITYSSFAPQARDAATTGFRFNVSPAGMLGGGLQHQSKLPLLQLSYTY